MTIKPLSDYSNHELLSMYEDKVKISHHNPSPFNDMNEPTFRTSELYAEIIRRMEKKAA